MSSTWNGLTGSPTVRPDLTASPAKLAPTMTMETTTAAMPTAKTVCMSVSSEGPDRIPRDLVSAPTRFCQGHDRGGRDDCKVRGAKGQGPRTKGQGARTKGQETRAGGQENGDSASILGPWSS